MPTCTKAGLRIALGGFAVLLVSTAVLPASAQQSSGVEKSAAPAPSLVQRASPRGPTDPAYSTYKELPDSPGVTLAKLQQADPVQNSPTPLSGEPSSAPPASAAVPDQPKQDQPAPAQPAPAQPIQAAPPAATPKPQGTAAAGANPATGVAASQPAGMAIAPAKQHRTRTLVLRTGAILGAGVALGSVFALTQGTSSKPPGAH